MKCKDCTIWACVRRKDGEQQCYYEEKKTAYEDVFWYRFRAEAAKDILCAVLSGGITSGMVGIVPEKENLAKISIEIADELVKQLKEKEA